MDFFYDGQIRRYVTQFMRIFIGFKYQTGDGDQRHVPVMYGDLSRQVASIIKENSENKLLTVPRISCYISGLELDTSRLSDASFVSKMHVRERAYNDFDQSGNAIYEDYQGAAYTIERLMPTPYKLSMKADIWTSNTDQKLQLAEQILVLFNPSLEIQTTDNYIDWTSLSVVDLKSVNFSSRTIPQGTESDIDICTIECEMPIYITPPAKVKRLGVVQNIIMNIFNNQGDVQDIQNLVYNGTPPVNIRQTPGNFGVLLLKSNNGISSNYDLSILNQNEAVKTIEDDVPQKQGKRIDWFTILAQHESYRPGISKVAFLQPNGFEIQGTFVVNEVDSTYLLVTIDEKPSNTVISGRTTVDAIIDPNKFSPQQATTGARYLILDDINVKDRFYDSNQDNNVPIYQNIDPNLPHYIPPDFSLGVRNLVNGQSYVILTVGTTDFTTIGAKENKKGIQFNAININHTGNASNPLNPTGSGTVTILGQPITGSVLPGVFAWEDFEAGANDIIEYTGTGWQVVFDSSANNTLPTYVQNLKTGIQYRWDGEQWLKSFEGEYRSGYWRFIM